jgi:hypothetical protein
MAFTLRIETDNAASQDGEGGLARLLRLTAGTGVRGLLVLHHLEVSSWAPPEDQPEDQ